MNVMCYVRLCYSATPGEFIPILHGKAEKAYSPQAIVSLLLAISLIIKTQTIKD